MTSFSINILNFNKNPFWNSLEYSDYSEDYSDCSDT